MTINPVLMAPEAWQGHVLDTTTQARVPVQIYVQPYALKIVADAGASQVWSYVSLHRVRQGTPGDPVCIRCDAEPSVMLVAYDPEFLKALVAAAPFLVKYSVSPDSLTRKIMTAVVALATVVAVFYWLIPALSIRLAPYLPVSLERRLGASLITQVAPDAKICHAHQAVEAVSRLIAQLVATVSDQPYQFNAVLVHDSTVNAGAVPGGGIVIYTGLLERTKTPEELAAVLAHEIQHVLNHHATRAWLQQATSSLLLHALVGHIAGGVASGLEGAQTLSTLRFSRQSEEEADAKGLHMLVAAHINPHGMIAMFETLQKQGDVPENLEYFSTHPRTVERLRALSKIAMHDPSAFASLLPELHWSSIATACTTGKTRSAHKSGVSYGPPFPPHRAQSRLTAWQSAEQLGTESNNRAPFPSTTGHSETKQKSVSSQTPNKRLLRNLPLS
jgi:Zn-dependent protease with chaperone function